MGVQAIAHSGSISEDTFAAVFHVFTPQLISFFRARGCEQPLSEDLAQEVMLIVYRKAAQIRDRTLFRAWLFKVAREIDKSMEKNWRYGKARANPRAAWRPF